MLRESLIDLTGAERVQCPTCNTLLPAGGWYQDRPIMLPCCGELVTFQPGPPPCFALSEPRVPI